jgi:hypothetical protein
MSTSDACGLEHSSDSVEFYEALLGFSLDAGHDLHVGRDAGVAEFALEQLVDLKDTR